MLVSVIVPVLNEGRSLHELYRQLCSAMDAIGHSYELVFVDDGSTDDSFDILRSLRDKDDRVKIIRFTKNFGQHPAMTAGFLEASGDILVTIDADLQNPPSEIGKLVARIEDGYDVAAGVRQNRRDPLLRKLPSYFVNKLIAQATGVALKDYGCSLRAYKRWVVEELNKCGEMSKFIPAYISWVGVNIAEVEILHNQRAHGKSRYDFLKLIRLTLDLVTGYSRVPVILCFLLSLALMGGGAGLLLLNAILDLLDYDVSGTAYVLSLMIACTGIVTLVVSLVGEYSARALIEVQKRPYYIIREKHI